MSAHKFYQLRCDVPGCKASKVGQVNETPSRMRRKKDGWGVVKVKGAYDTTYPSDRCPDHAN